MFIYLKDYSNFLSQGLSLREGKVQLISNSLIKWWRAGIIIFGLAIMCGLKRIQKNLILFVWELLSLMSVAFFILALLTPQFKLSFRFLFLVSSFILYYSINEAKRFFKS